MNSKLHKTIRSVYFLALLFSLSGCKEESNVDYVTNTQLPTMKQNLSFYKSCDDLRDDIKKSVTAERIEKSNYEAWLTQYGEGVAVPHWGMPVATEAQADSSAGETSEGGTNIQERGVDEADIAKLSSGRLSVVSDRKVVVTDPEKMEVLGQISLEGLQSASLYTEGERLIVIAIDGDRSVFHHCTSGDLDCAPVEGIVAEQPVRSYKAHTKVRVYDLADVGTFSGSDFKLLSEVTYEGEVLRTRLLNGRLYLVFSDPLVLKAYRTGRPEGVVVADGERIRGVKCDQVFERPIDDLDYRLTRLIVHDVVDLSAKDQVTGVMGGADQIYMTSKSLYLAKNGIRWYGHLSVPDRLQQKLVLNRIALDIGSGDVSHTGHSIIEGNAFKPWNFKELNDGRQLSVVTSTSSTEGWSMDHHLTVLENSLSRDRKMGVLSKVDSFVKNETLHSVRYVGDMAYVVTFQRIDPLFVFDLSDPAKPDLKGELKVPGFSDYLQPVFPGYLVGVGSLGWDVQISLFDVTRAEDPKRASNLVLRDTYASGVQYDHHAFYYDAQSSMIAIPISSQGSNRGGGYYWSKHSLILATVSVESGVNEVARITHDDFKADQTCYSSLAKVRRLFKYQDRYISVSQAGIKSHLQRFPGETEKMVKFRVAESCH